MSRTKQDKSYWSETYRVGRVRIYAWERLDRGGVVYLKYRMDDASGRDTRVKTKLDGDFTVRDKKGELDKRKIADVAEAVHTLGARLLLGHTPAIAPAPVRALTIREGFEALLDHRTGKFPTKTRRWDEVSRAVPKIERIVGGRHAWADITPAVARRLWRTLANESKAGSKDRRGSGMRQAEVTVDALYSTANWLRAEDKIPATAALAEVRWRLRLKNDWREITGVDDAPARPRHSADEMRRIFEALQDERVDPRFGLAFDLGGEQRIGQIIRCTRKDLDTQSPEYPHGILRPKSVGHKKASPIVLNSEQRTRLDRALSSGYLALYDQALIRGEIADFPLFPAGRLRKGRAVVKQNALPLSRDGARKMFRELERVAEVSPVKGRAWYGVRRIATDLAEDVESDERVLNSITGHTDSATRQQIYQDQERPEVLKRAATTRQALRGWAKVPPVPKAVHETTRGTYVPHVVPQNENLAFAGAARLN